MIMGLLIIIISDYNAIIITNTELFFKWRYVLECDRERNDWYVSQIKSIKLHVCVLKAKEKVDQRKG